MSELIHLTADAPEYVGKRLLVGITHQTADEEFLFQEQFHGEILEAGAGGIVIHRSDTGGRYKVPPQLHEASPGHYRLRSTGEVVIDPDYLSTWVITEGAANSEH